jgi:DNA topoisomerase-1
MANKNLIIVESPAKAKTISKFAGSSFFVKASIGHIRDLPKSSLGVDVEKNFTPKYVVDKAKKKIITELKEAAAKADSIYLASDHDREGEAIAWHLSEVLKKEISGKPVHRIIFNEITKSAITKAISEPDKIDMNKVDSQQARRILDRIVGYSLSPMLWKVISKNLSAGRVQSVALRLICEREEEIDNFKPQEYWTIEAHLKKDEMQPFKATLKKWNQKKIEIPNSEKAQEIYQELEKQAFILDSVSSSNRKIQPSPAYITSTLQQDAARILQFSAKKTMMLAQQLYEGIDLNGETVGLITYMRTDSLRIADEALNSCRNLIKERFGETYLHSSKRYFKNKSSAQDAHEAIRPTDSFHTPESIKASLSNDQWKLYNLIWSKFISTQMKPIEVKTLQLTISAGKGQFTAQASAIVFDGFMKAFPHVTVMLGETIEAGYLDLVEKELELEKLTSTQNFTQPPSRYREPSLIKELEAKGIGRPSTYASIINTILDRKYVELITKNFHPTELGKAVNLFLVNHFDNFFNTEFTAKMEANLDEIEFGNVRWQELLKDYYDKMVAEMSLVDIKSSKKELEETTDIKCSKCDGVMVKKWGKNGAFLSCSSYPECTEIYNFERDENGAIKIIKPETIGEKCPQCGNELMQKTGRFGKFIACSNYPKCKYTKPFTLGIKCPQCKTGEITEKKNKKGKIFYSCSNYPDCKYISNYKPVAIACDSCGNYYLEERETKAQGKFKKCPSCGKEFF